MKIALLMTEGWTFGGIQLVNRMLVDSFLASEKVGELFVLSLNDSLDRIEMRNDDRVRYVGLGGRRTSIPTSLPLTTNFDLIFASHIATAPIGLMLRRKSSLMVAVLHGIESWRRVSGLNSFALRRCDKLLSVSEHTIGRFRTANPQLKSCVVEHWPLAIDRPPHIGRKSEPGNGNVLLIGRMESSERYKGHDEMLEVWPAIVSQFPRSRLSFVGKGDDVERLKQKAISLGIVNSVDFLCGISNEEMGSLLKTATAFAMPSKGEGFGLVFLEAMAAGLPCIAGSQDAAKEVVLDGETGILVDAFNRESLQNALSLILGDMPFALRLGQAGYDRWQQHFRFDAFRDRTLRACGIVN